MREFMDERELNIFDMFRDTTQFDVVNAADYAHLPQGEAKFAIVRAVIAKLEIYASKKTSGARGQAVELKSVVRAAIRRKLVEYARNARILNFNDPGFRRLFNVPNGDNDQILLATAREFVEQVTLHQAAFKDLGVPDGLLGELSADIDALEQAISAKAGAHIEGVGATAGIDEEIEKGMDAEVFLDNMMKNVYRNNPVKLAEWKSARHVRRRNSTPTPPKPEETPTT